MTEQEVILSDLSGCLPGDALTAAPGKPGTWMLFAYETEAVGDLPTFAGNMIYGAGRLESPPLSLPLPVAGWYSIYVGCWHNIHVGGSSLRLQLRQDRFEEIPKRFDTILPFGGGICQVPGPMHTVGPLGQKWVYILGQLPDEIISLHVTPTMPSSCRHNSLNHGCG